MGTLLQNRYRIGSLLGEGGCGRVYAATHAHSRGQVAIKFLLPAWTQHAVMRARFEREAQLLARLHHPGIVAAHDYGEDGGELFLVLEYVAGQQLGRVMREQEGTLPIPRVICILDQILDGLAAAHADGVTHRDIKPSNIMLYQDAAGTERLKLLDFGLAWVNNTKRQPRLTRQGQILGTTHYMAPEQCLGQAVGPPTDIYSLGVILYQLLSGRLPFDAKSPTEIMHHHVAEPPPPLERLGLSWAVPPELAALTMWALEKPPTARPTALQLRHALRTFVQDSGLGC